MHRRHHHVELKVYGVFNKTGSTQWGLPFYHSPQSLSIMARAARILLYKPVCIFPNRAVLSDIGGVVGSTFYRIGNAVAVSGTLLRRQAMQQGL